MEPIQILVAGTNPDIMKIILRLLGNQPGWNSTSALSADEAIAKSGATRFDLVLLGAGLSDAEAEIIRRHFTVPVIQHYGGGSGLLYAEIYQALGIS